MMGPADAAGEVRPIDLVVPTLGRPEQLARALRSLFAQDGLDRVAASLVVVDNDPEASAATVVEALRPACPIPLVYVHEPRPGIATARNAGVAAGSAPIVAFLDDDEEAPPHWLRTLHEAHRRLGAAVTFGPVRGVAASAPAALRPYFDRFFSREGGAATELIDIPFGCGNSMLERAEALAGPAPFDPAQDAVGGEDDRLFYKLKGQGARFGWAAEAWVLEYAPAHRTRLGYTLRRAFAYGQSPCQHDVRRGDVVKLARDMFIGLGQAGVYGAAASGLALLGRRGASVGFLDQAVRGVGKLFWPLRLDFYGASALRAQRRAAATTAPRDPAILRSAA